MDHHTILLPGLLLSCYTLLFFAYMGFCRYQATVKREVSVKYYRSYRGDEEPERLQVLSRHATNLLEIPIIYYSILAYISIIGINSLLLEILAWLYLFARLVHAYIHLGYNNVTHRFYAFGLSLIFLLVMIIMTAYELLTT